jgi:hypothetical protein
MNYTLIGQTDDSSYHDRCGDFISRPGEFTVLYFPEEDKHAFLWAWAQAKYHNTYENLIILTNGIPEDRLEDDDYYAFQDLEREMDAFYPEIHAKHEAAEAAKKEAAAQAALAKARKIAADQLERDLAQLTALQKKLGLS